MKREYPHVAGRSSCQPGGSGRIEATGRLGKHSGRGVGMGAEPHRRGSAPELQVWRTPRPRYIFGRLSVEARLADVDLEIFQASGLVPGSRSPFVTSSDLPLNARPHVEWERGSQIRRSRCRKGPGRRSHSSRSDVQVAGLREREPRGLWRPRSRWVERELVDELDIRRVG